MARIDTLHNFLTDVSSAIKEKKGDSTPIPASDFDTEITNLPSGGTTEPFIDSTKYFFYGRGANAAELLKLVKTDVANFKNAFEYSGSLPAKVDMSKFSLQDYQYCFYRSSSSTTTTIEFNPNVDVTNLYYAFNQSNFVNLTIKNLKSTATLNVYYLSNTFQYMYNLETLTFENCNIDASGSSGFQIQYMFNDCRKIQEIDLTPIKFRQTMKRTVLGASAFYNCQVCTKILLPNITLAISTAGDMFNGCSACTEIDLGGLTFDYCSSYSNMFKNCTSLQTVYVLDSTVKTFIDARLAEAGLSITSTIKGA